MTTKITTAARTIARHHNAHVRAGMARSGFLLFHRDGTGGYWYSDASRPAMSPDLVRIDMRPSKMTTEEAQEALDS